MGKNPLKNTYRINKLKKAVTAQMMSNCFKMSGNAGNCQKRLRVAGKTLSNHKQAYFSCFGSRKVTSALNRPETLEIVRNVSESQETHFQTTKKLILAVSAQERSLVL